jgi:type VI secretion system secreted protein Hcp
MKYDQIAGDVTSSKYPQWIEVLSWSWGATNTAQSSSSGQSSKPTVSEIVVTKDVDSASTPLLKDTLAGTHGQTVTVSFVKGDATGQQYEYLTFTLTDTFISQWTIDWGDDKAAGSADPVEGLSFSFQKCDVVYHKDNTENNDGEVSFDLTTGLVS